jgi:hypothetical protein
MNMTSKPIFADTVVVEPTPNINQFIGAVKMQYHGSETNDKIASDIIELIEKIKKGSYNVRNDEHGTVFEKIFSNGNAEEELELEEETCKLRFEISLEALDRTCTEYADYAYVPIVVFHAYSINNEVLSVLNRDLSLPTDTIRPSTIKGMVAISYSVGGY